MSERGNKIRPVALGLVVHDDKLLATECTDRVKNQIFYRPLGGGIEFGEQAERTVKREIKEEIGEEVTNVNYLGTVENIFVYEGKPGHEIVMLFRAGFLNEEAYKQNSFPRIDSRKPYRAYWKSVSDFISGKLILYPEGIIKFLKN